MRKINLLNYYIILFKNMQAEKGEKREFLLDSEKKYGYIQKAAWKIVLLLLLYYKNCL